MTRHKTRHRGIYYRNGSTDPDAGPRRYIVWYADSFGKGHTETLPLGATEKDALARQGELRGKLSRGEKVVPTRLTVADALDQWWADRGKAGLKPKTAATYEWSIEKQLKPRLGRLRLSSLSVDDVAGMVATMQTEGLKAWTIRGCLTPLSRMLLFAMRRGWVNANPVAQLEQSERPKSDQARMRILDTAEIEKLLAGASSTRWRTLFAFLTFTGTRIGEALALRWSDVDFEAGLVTVRDSKTEAGEDRRIVLMPALARLLREHRVGATHSLQDDLIFSVGAGGPVSARNALRALSAALEKAGVEHCTLHELRHTFASLLIGEGQDVTFVADQLGHANPQITLRLYAKLFDPARRRDEAREKLQAAFGGML